MAFRLLHPDHDSLTVTGSDNATYWLMLLVRSEAIHQNKYLYFIAVAFEIFFLVAGFPLHIRGFVRLWKLSAIHINFLLVLAGMYTMQILGSIARLLTIPYETKILQVSGFHEAPIPFLAHVRQASYSDTFLILWVVTIERTFATLYVADYEKKRRLHISFILNATIFIASFSTGYAVVRGVLNGFVITLIVLAPNFVCAILFRLLIRYNERRLARLTDQVKRYSDEYSLSLRVQLKENIRSMRKIEFGVYLLTFGLAANIGQVFAPILTLTHPDQFETLQWFTCCGNLIYAFAIFCTAPWLDVAIAIHTGNAPSILRLFLGMNYFSKKSNAVKSEIDGYFNQLNSQWSYGLRLYHTRTTNK